MIIIEHLKDNIVESSSLALGFFDGVHLGHQKVLNEAITKAKELNIKSVALTFKKHPIEVLYNSPTKLIEPLSKRIEAFEKAGVDIVVVLDFNEKMAQLGPDEYLQEVLIKPLNPKHITVGFNHFFGHNKKGDTNLLKELGKKYNYGVSVIEPVKLENKTVSSTAIKEAIETGDVKTAFQMLGRPFSVENKVVKGKQQGKKIGFPTANILPKNNSVIPQEGVYAGTVNIWDDFYKAVINVGKCPTIEKQETTIEAHILDFHEKNIYGKTIKIDFLQKIRDENKFESVEELKKQIENDIEIIK